MEGEESNQKPDMSEANALTSKMESNTVYPEHDEPPASTESETTSTESASNENSVQNTESYQKSEPSVTLKPDDNIIKDNINVKEENKEEKKEKEEHQSEDEDSDDDEEAVLESSPCGRWHKRKEQVRYRDIPGIDIANLAMDSEEGVEVVWNEARFTSTKKFKAQEENMKNVFEALTTIDHPNIVKFHKYWIDYGPPKDTKIENLKETAKKSDADVPLISSEQSSIAQTKNSAELTEDKELAKSGTETKGIERMDSKVDKEAGGKKYEPRLIFITEYMSSGSLKQFLRKTKRNNRRVQVQSWKRWCIQILSALNHLHTTCDPPIVHGNLNCDTIFIQHNGLVKIGSVAPDIIHHNVKTCRDSIRNLHFFAPEWGEDRTLRGQPIDIYAFGMAALETAALDIQATPPLPNGEKDNISHAGVSGVSPLSVDGSGAVTEDAIQRTIDQLEDNLQKDFIRKCLNQDPEQRPTARSLLFHPVLFEVHSLKLLAAHVHVNTPDYDTTNANADTVTDEAIQLQYGPDTVMAVMKKRDGKDLEYRYKDFSVAEKLGKFMEDVKFGIYPITAFALSQPDNPKTRSGSQEDEIAGLVIQNTVEAPILSDSKISKVVNLEHKTDTEEEQESDEESGDEDKDKGNEDLKKSKEAEDDLKGIEYVTNLKILSCLLHMGPPVPRIMEYAVCVYRLQNSMNRQASTWVSTRDTPIKLAISLMEEKALKPNMVITYAAMFTRGFIQRSREIDEFWEHYMRYEEQKAKGRNEEFKRQTLPIALKVHQSWLINVAKHYGFLDDRPGINDKHQAPDGMVWVHDSDYNAAVAWLLKHQVAMQADPPLYYSHPDCFNAPWMDFEKRLNGEPLVPVKQKNKPMEQNWPPWNGPIEEYNHGKFPEDTPGKKLLEFLTEERNKNPVSESEEATYSEKNGPQIDMINVLKAEVERVHYQYETQHGHGIVHSLDMAGVYSNDCIPMPVAPEALTEALRPIAQFREGLSTDLVQQQVTEEHLNQLMAEASGHAPAAQLRRALEAAAHLGGTVRLAGQLPGDFSSDGIRTVADTELDVVPMGPIEVDPLMTQHENAMVLAQQFKHLPQLVGNQKYVVVPETEDGQACPPMFLDNDQLVHLQAMANAQAHFVVQQPSSSTPSDVNAEDTQDQQQGNFYSPYMQEGYEQYPFYQGVNQEDVQYGATDYTPYRGQMFPHQGNLNLDGRACVQDISSVVENNGSALESNDNNEPGTTNANAMVSSPSVEEELAQLQIVDSDTDEPKHHKADIAAAALTSSITCDRQDSPFTQDNKQ